MTLPYLNRIYYALKPYLPWRMRLAVRRWFALRKRRRVEREWPILEAAGRPPAGWSGWPGTKQFALVLTHDVEGQRGLDRCRQLAEMEMQAGFRSSFNLIPEGEYQTPPELRHWLVEKGFEVGVHDLNHDGWLYRSREGFRKKAIRINQYIKEWGAVGFRSGFMHHNYEWLHDLNVLYDGSSFDTDPFEPQPDGVGTIFPFWIPAPSADPASNRKEQPATVRRGYVELPYTLAQDFNLFIVLKEQSGDVWKRKLDWIAARGGMALLSTHPDYMAFAPENGPFLAGEFPAARYQEFLEYVRSKYDGRYWHALPKDVAAFVRDRQLDSVSG